VTDTENAARILALSLAAETQNATGSTPELVVSRAAIYLEFLTGNSESPAKSAKAKAAPKSAAPAATSAPVAASAPAAAAPAAVEPPTYMDLTTKLNPMVSKLAGLDRGAALAILLKHGASATKTSTSQLKPEKYQVVFDETEEALAKIEAAAAQNPPSLI
jgi:hypothetical protein